MFILVYDRTLNLILKHQKYLKQIDSKADETDYTKSMLDAEIKME